ncbi:outer membrane protein [Rhizobium leguminosarum]|uniref:Porin family protein n=1 Tax=Rhizobium leguminosarum TaxID=384 RepID=A0ABD7PUT7_RHILE|nr:outer membrane protein [Rhizobium leguminosarum]TAV75258.1 porin family protein [Rhizobium leguminosarum]TAV79857.1 porin family protein [Rhizobium leguminosarum]TAW31193.1 porin family protein [Rhizobium leguminosarum]TAW44921.1 porin family protein [Rhizobium leguminosarum]TAZ31588.1 porin family protein [Rhizobium leguminosarum]
MKRSLSGIFAALLIATNAYSADLAPAEPIPEQPPEVTVTEATGWYLRGDVGYAFTDLRGARYFQGSNATEVDFDRADLDDAWTVGGGVGYQINSYLRTDLTFDYLTQADFKGSTVGQCGFPLVDCTSSDRSSLTAYTLLANAYVDLGTYGYVTPYVGAGIGGSYVKWKNLRNVACADDGSFCDDEVTHGGKGNWRFTYALMAGASVDVTCNVKADVGYRYLHIDGGNMFGYAENGGPGRDKGLSVHEARVGARYLFGGCAQASYEPPPEIPLQQPVYK